MSLEILVTTAVSLLVSFFTKAGESAAQKVGEDIYQQLKGRLRGKAAAREALAELQRQPRDADVQATVRFQLRKLLADDKTLAESLRRSVEPTAAFHANSVAVHQKAGHRSVQIGVANAPVTVSNRIAGQLEELGALLHAGVVPLALMLLGAVVTVVGFVWFVSSGQAMVNSRDIGGFDRVMVPFFVSGAGALLMLFGKLLAASNLHRKDKGT